MRNRFMLLLVIALLALAASLLATDVTNLYSFTGIPDGSVPIGSLVADASGNLYGVTFTGGTTGGCTRGGVVNCGTAFELTPGSDGTWTESVIYNFGNPGDASVPSAGLVIDRAGNLYGVAGGGANGQGAVFELSPPSGGGGSWTENVLYNFNGVDDGSNPAAALMIDSAGNLYGTTQSGGTYDSGTVFELSHSGGAWTTLYSFEGGINGRQPQSNLVMDTEGALYGTTFSGGMNDGGFGTIFKLTPPSGGGPWTQTVLHRFQGSASDGKYPQGNIVLSGEALYGTATSIVFKLSPKVGGTSFSPLFVFSNNNDGYSANSGVILGPGSKLFGTAETGGKVSGGTVFQLVPKSGTWAFSVLANVGKLDLAQPEGLLIYDDSLFGLTGYGGDLSCVSGAGGGLEGCGAVFSIAP